MYGILLEADVDIRYIQEMLGHSSINITEIYTHVAVSKQRDILTAKMCDAPFLSNKIVYSIWEE